MNFSAFTSVLAVLLAGCLAPLGERVIPPRDIHEAVVAIEGWDLGCDNLGNCVAIAALPPRKNKMVGIRAAIRVDLGRLNEPDAGLTIIPLDSEQRLPDVKPTPTQAKAVITQLRAGTEFMIWLQVDGDRKRYFFPGQNFAEVEQLHQAWTKKYPVRWVEAQTITPTKAVRLSNFTAPILDAKQIAECDDPAKGNVKSAWDIGATIRLFQYACSAPGGLHSDSLWFLLDKPTGRFSAIGLDEATGLQTEGKAAGLHNAYFDDGLGLLVTRKFSGTKDCGVSATYAATPSGFVLAVRREARHCAGLFIGDWIQTYRSPGVILPDHW